MARIVLLTGNHLCHNPRVMKEAGALATAGFEVEVLGGCVDAGLRERDRDLARAAPYRFTPVFDSTATTVGRFARRATAKIRASALRVLRMESPAQLGQGAAALLAAARARRADLYIAHSEAGLHAGAALMDLGRRVGVDMEDWFSEDLPPQARAGRPVRLLRELEARLLREGAHATCPSHAMSEALAAEYGCAPPAVIYNAFPWAERGSLDGAARDRAPGGPPTIHWFSQTAGPGRGLEDLFAALPALRTAVRVHLRGAPMRGFEEWLRAVLPPGWRERVSVHPPVANAELLSRIAEHDIGFAGEATYCRSRDLTVTNKILEYLRAGLAVVASATAGQREVAQRAPEAVRLYPPGDARALAARIDELLASGERLASARAAALHAAQNTFAWEHEAPRLLAAVERALAAPARAASNRTHA
jgi:glycosyltransferase involved in cell wall biosynthesis